MMYILKHFCFLIWFFTFSALWAQGTITKIQIKNIGTEDFVDDPIVLSHVFAQGDAKGRLILMQGSTALSTQTDVKTRYTDGSIRQAILSFKPKNLSMNSELNLDLVPTNATSVAPTLTKEQILRSDFDAVVTITENGSIYTVSARELLQKHDSTQMWLDGNVVREFLIEGRPQNATNQLHAALNVQFQVRFFDTTRAWVSVVVENVWSHYRKNIQYNVLITMGRSSPKTIYSQNNLNHYRDARWRKTSWWGRTPPLTEVVYDRKYLAATGMIPQYDTSIQITSSVSIGDTSVMGHGSISLYFPETGGREDIGLYPAWAARYLCSFKNTYWRQIYINGQQGASAPIHIRDMQTGRVYSIDQHPTVSLNEGARPWSASSDTLPLPIGNTPWTVDDAHQPSLAYIPYLFSGEYFFLQELYNWANYNFLSQNFDYRGRDSGLVVALQVRGQAWTLRTLADAAVAAPDESWEKKYFQDKLNKNLAWFNRKMVGSNAIGMWGNQSNVGSDGGRPDEWMRGDVRYYVSPWMSDFLAISMHHVLRLGNPLARAPRDWLASNTIGRFSSAPGYNPFDGSPYHLASTDTLGRTYANWSEVWQASFYGRTTPAPTTIASDDCVHGYPYIARAVLAFSVAENLPKAQTAWDFLQPKLSGSCWDTAPTWAMIPGKPWVEPLVQKQHSSSDPILSFHAKYARHDHIIQFQLFSPYEEKRNGIATITLYRITGSQLITTSVLFTNGFSQFAYKLDGEGLIWVKLQFENQTLYKKMSLKW